MLDTLIDFLVRLFRDDEAKQAFDQNPDGELARNGLSDVSAQDVRDARLIMADRGGMHAREGAARPSSNDDDPVREIRHTTEDYQVDQDFQQINVVNNIDDRDITVIDDSFNSDDDTDVDSVAIQDNSQETNVVQVKDSFNDKEEEPEPEEPAEEPDPPVDEVPAEEPVPFDIGEPVDADPEPEPAETFVG